MRRNRATTISMPSTGRVDASAESRSKFGDRLKIDRAVQVDGLVDAGAVPVDMTPGFVITFDKGSGQTVWELPGRTYGRNPISSTRSASSILPLPNCPGANSFAACLRPCDIGYAPG